METWSTLFPSLSHKWLVFNLTFILSVCMFCWATLLCVNLRQFRVKHRIDTVNLIIFFRNCIELDRQPRKILASRFILIIFQKFMSPVSPIFHIVSCFFNDLHRLRLLCVHCKALVSLSQLYLIVINFVSVIISVLYVICLASLNTGTPLLFELGCELSHPVSEEIVAGSFDQVL